MARREIVTLIDDLDGEPAAGTVRFGLDGTAYEIDLSEENSGALYERLAPFVAVARKASNGHKPAARVSRPNRNADTAGIRAWAREKGLDVSDRGRVSSQIRAAYDAAH